jgi:hypothetical protein
MKNVNISIGRAALISSALVLPFAILEIVNQSITRQSSVGLITLFGLLWLLPMVFIVILAPLVRNVRAGSSVIARPVYLVLRLASLAFITVIWAGIVMDQLPCFLGVPNCD